MAGLLPDARQLITRAREECRGYRQNYGGVIPPRVLNDRMGSYVHLHTVYWYLRPTGAAILLGGYDPEAKNHELYCVEPNGMAVRYFGYAIGEGRRSVPGHRHSALPLSALYIAPPLLLVYDS